VPDINIQLTGKTGLKAYIKDLSGLPQKFRSKADISKADLQASKYWEERCNFEELDRPKQNYLCAAWIEFARRWANPTYESPTVDSSLPGAPILNNFDNPIDDTEPQSADDSPGSMGSQTVDNSSQQLVITEQQTFPASYLSRYIPLYSGLNSYSSVKGLRRLNTSTRCKLGTCLQCEQS
jgi:hypothetical protein